MEEKEQESTYFIDIKDCKNYKMTTEQKKEIDENIVMFVEGSHEDGMLRIMIPLRVLPALTKEQRKEMIMAHLADLFQKEL